MTRRLCLSALAICLFTAATSQNEAQAQTLSIGRGGVQYNGYGRGYYGGYGQGYREYGSGYNYGPRTNSYSSYGYGPYGYGNRSYYNGYGNRSYYNGYGNGSYYNGYGNSGYYVPNYSPYGFGVYVQ